MSAEGMLTTARDRLKAALELLGSGSEETVADDQLLGASVLASETSATLRMLFERRNGAE